MSDKRFNYYTSQSYEDFENVALKSSYSSDKYIILGQGEKTGYNSYKIFGSFLVTDGKYFKMYEKYLAKKNDRGLRIEYRPRKWSFGTIDKFTDDELIISEYSESEIEVGHELVIHDNTIIYNYGSGDTCTGFIVLANDNQFEILYTGKKYQSIVWENNALYYIDRYEFEKTFICSTDPGYKPRISPFKINIPQMDRTTFEKSDKSSSIYGQGINSYLNGYGFQRWSDININFGEIYNSFYLGEFKDGYKHGIGAYHSANFDYYFGTYAKDKKHGFGMYKEHNGYVELNSYVDGVIDGVCFEIYDEYLAVVLYKNGVKCADYYRIYYNFDIEICDKYRNIKRKIVCPYK